MSANPRPGWCNLRMELPGPHDGIVEQPIPADPAAVLQWWELLNPVMPAGTVWSIRL